MKRIISYSLWGTEDLYIKGAIKNAEARERFYPDWTCRFYIDETTVPLHIVETLADTGAEIRRMGQSVDVLGMYWRFRPMFDDASIERFIVRDTDSFFSSRETAAVHEWCESGLPLHVVRDCESHGVPILGGTWGALPLCVANFEIKMCAWIAQVKPIPENPRGLYHGTDQMFLTEALWRPLQNRCLAHIRAGCEGLRFHPNDRELPPLGADGHYVGMVGGWE